ncbi:MAG: Helix-turn-helix domain [Chloroflexota bacterium]|jgi:transcriptional regulator with XRE-family HTH domain
MSNHDQSHAAGRRIAAYRQARGLTQRELAERLGWPRQSLINLELGRRGATVEKLVAVAKVLSLPPALFLLDDARLARVVEELAADPGALADVQFFLTARAEDDPEPPPIA